MSSAPPLPEPGCPQLQFPAPGTPASVRWSCAKSTAQAEATSGHARGPTICVKVSSFWNDW